MDNFENKYVAYCDILGFSDAVLTQFAKTLSIYKEFKKELEGQRAIGLKTSVYSDSIIIVGETLVEVTKTVQILLWTTLRHNWLVRGGIGYGKHWEESDESNLQVVSEALVKAVKIEKTIKPPIIAISDEISIGLEYWIHGFTHSVFDLPIIHYDGMNIVNPFNNYWFTSAEMRLGSLRDEHPNHRDKYNYLLEMIKAVKKSAEFVPRYIIDSLLEQNFIKKL